MKTLSDTQLSPALVTIADMQTIEEVLVLSPSDLVAFTGCEHRSYLDRLVARGELDRPRRDDPFNDVLRKHGQLHEARYLASLRREGFEVVAVERPSGGLAGLRAAEEQTLAAMRGGADVIYQASFFDGRWRGHADFLRRVESGSDLGPWSYEAHDTKLARTTKAATLLQLGEYSRQLARLQGRAPRCLHVVLGDGTIEGFLFADISAYLDTVRSRFETAIESGLVATAPEPVALCSYCDWKDRCTALWRREDHLSLVAGARRDQRAHLMAGSVTTRTALAELPSGTEVPELRDVALAGAARPGTPATRVGAQPDARVGAPRSRPCGTSPRPRRAAGAVRRRHLLRHGGRPVRRPRRPRVPLRVDRGSGPVAPFRELWAHDPDAEKAAFEGFIDTVMSARRRDPGMHVYHYGSYEQTRMKRLMGRYATREDEVDILLRAGVFVDLHRVVRQSVRVGVESYSIKKLEPLYMETRAAGITDAGTSVVQYEMWLDDRDDHILESIREYNREDCGSLVGLRGWLEARRAELEGRLGTLPRPPLTEGSAPEAVSASTAEVDRLAAELTHAIPVDPQRQSGEQRALVLLAGLLDWHRREAKPGWWEYYARRDASDDDLIEDASAVAGLVFEGEVGVENRSRLYRFSFPVQETKLKAGDSVEDPRTFPSDSGAQITRRVGAIGEIHPTSGTLVIKRKDVPSPMPTAVIGGGPLDATVLRKALMRVGEWVAANGINSPGSFRAGRDLLLRRSPRIAGVAAGETLRWPGEEIVVAARRCIRDADQTCLPIQGPPGSGKTHTGALAIVDLVTAVPRRRVAVTALSHRAITQLVGRICAEARRRGVAVRVMQRSDERGCDDPQVECVDTHKPIVAALDEGTVDVVAGTPWLLARDEMYARFDTLFVDEAGQLSLANVLAVSGCARNLVLLGDPQQLEQPSQGSHPSGAQASALGHVLNGQETIAPDHGLFLDITWRMHPDVCAYVSANFYNSRLRSSPESARQRVLGADDLAGTGLRWLPVEHSGNRSASDQEAVAVASLVARLVGRRWIDIDGVERPLSPTDILVVAPYNAHVAALRRVVSADVAIGTVDRFQGQEAAVVVYSMATSVAEDVPRGMEFLYSRNRMNVAVSRARCMAVVVCSPELLQVACTTAAQIPLANALCSFTQRAVVVDAVVGAREATEPALV